jgi:ribosomal protein L13E
MRRRISFMMATRPFISRKNGKQRTGKGFSGEELKKAGLSFKEALKLGVPVDLRRKTVHERNIDVIKGFLESRKKAAEPKKRRKSKS